MLIPVMIPPYDDEWYNSWINRLASANSMEVKKFNRLFLNICKLVDNNFYNIESLKIIMLAQYPKGLFWLKEQYEYFPNPWKLFFKNLNLAAEAVNERPEVTAKIVQDILFHGSDPSKNVNAKYPKKKLVYCPVCARMDLEKGIKPYLRTWHYVGSPVVCAVHKCKLKELACLSDEITDLTVSYVDPNGKDMDDAKMGYQNYQAMADTADDDLEEDEEKPCYYDRSLTYLREKSAFVKCRCKKCGLEFWNTKYAIEVGRSCPRCEENVLEHQLMLVGGGEYWFIRKVDDIGTKECIIHQVCGRVIGLSATRVIWNGQRCRCLQRDLMRARGCEHFKKMLKEIHGNEFEHIGRYENSRRQAYICHSKCKKSFQMFPTRKNVKNLKCPYCTPSKSKPKRLPGISIPVEK